MDRLKKTKKVPLPSASETEQQTAIEQQIIEKILVSGKETLDTQSVHSESDNEGVSTIVESVDVVDKVINKVTDAENKKLLETDIDKIGEEVIEILREKSVERDENSKVSLDDATSKNTESNADTIEAEKNETVKEKTEIIEEKSVKIDDEKIIENLNEEKVEQSSADNQIVSDEDKALEIEDKHKETIIDENLLPKESVDNLKTESTEHNKPPVPIQTYMWEDIKRSKEQGGYPWTHLYKRPLGEDEEPEVILQYDRSPKSGRRSQPETPKSQKKVRIQDEVETCEEIVDTQEEEPQEDETESQTAEIDDNKDNLQVETGSIDVKKSPKSILKKSQKLLENIKPNTSKFDSDSLKRKIKSPLQKIKKMADQQISKVKSKSSIKKIPVGKDEIVLNEKLEILKLKESPKSHHRELPAFIVKQDSDDTIDIVELEQSPSESRKQRLIESGIVTPDEIINLPVSTDNNTQEPNSCKKSDNEEHESQEQVNDQTTVQKSNDKEMSPTTVTIHKRKEHIYEEIDDFVSKIAFDSEHVDRVTFEKENVDVTKQDNITDPLFDEFSREMNKKIRKSLTSQDDSIKRELMKRNPKIEELEKQMSDDYKEEQLGDFDDIDVQIRNPRTLAPLSSVDSTMSHDETDLAKKPEEKQHIHKHSDKELSPTTVIIHKKNENIYEEIDNFIAKIAFDPEHVERVKCIDEKNPQDINLEQHDNITDPIFDEFSREMNKQIRKSLSHDDSVRNELAKKIPKIKDLEKQLSTESTHSNKEPYVHKHDDKEMSPTTVFIHKRKESLLEEIDDVVAKIAFDSENVERATYEEKNPHDAELAKHDNVTDPLFDEFSREMNKKIKKSLSQDHEDVKQEVTKKIPKIKDLDQHKSTDSNDESKSIIHKHDDKEMSPTTVIIHKNKGDDYKEIDDIVADLAFDTEHVERVTYDEQKPHEIKLIKQDNVIDPLFDEFSRELNKSIRQSLSSQDDTIKQELMRKVPKIEELEKQLSDEDREEKIEQVDDIEVVIRSTHLLAPISSIDSTSSDEDRRAQLSIVAEESETSDSKKKSFETEPSVDIHDVESLKNDESDVSTLIDDNKFEIESPKMEVDVESAQDESQKKEAEVESAQEESPKKVEEKDFREDVELKDTEVPTPIKINPKWSKMSDHEYEPIGEPMLDDNEMVDDSQLNENQKRKSSDPLEQGNEKKLLRSPSDESEDNISAQDFQDQIESRFFRKEIEPISDNEGHVHEEDTFEEAVIIDEEPVAREVPKKKSFIESAQNSGKNFQNKIKATTSSIKTSINNKIKKKPKEKPVAVEVAHVEKDEEPQTDEIVVEEKETVEPFTINVQEAEEEASKSKQSKMSKLTKNIKKPTMPKFNKPQFKKPQMPKMPDLKVAERFGNLRKLGRSKSMKESSNGDSSSLNTPEVASAEPSSKKKFDFGTYPRLIRDKFKRPKLPQRSDASMISESPAPDEDFNRVSQTFAQRGPVASRWPEYIEEESGKYQHFDSESDLDRDRMEFEREEVRHMMTEEQRQLDDMDRENFQIHLMAQQEKFRKPYIERQGSDVASEDDKLMWSGMLNKNVKEDEEEFEQNALRYDDDDYKFNLEAYNTQNINRSSTPQTNQETQSSGSSGVRRRGGFLDDDDEYFMREQRATNKVGAAGDYVDSAIKEGLGQAGENALTQIGSYDDEIERNHHELSPEKPTRSLKRKKKHVPQEDETVQNEPVAFDFYKTYPPRRPVRSKKSVSMEPDEDINFEQDIPDDSSDILDEHEMGTFKGMEHPDLAYLHDDFDNELDYNAPQMPVPPTPPRRRKKKIHGLQPHGFMSLRNEHLTSKQKPLPVENDEVIVYRQEHNFVPLAQEERLTTPTPTPRRTRSRSRSQISAYTLDDAESFKKDSVDEFNTIIAQENKENDYAVIKKETPPKAAVRRKRSTKSLGREKQFATLPLMPRRSEHELAPPRPPRNYSTIVHDKPDKPDKPPRRKSACSLVEISKTIKDDDYEEILDTSAADNRLSQRLQSGDIINKMKDRPLPPPPRPKRENKKPRRNTTGDDKFDNDEAGAERITTPLTVNVDEVERTIEREPAILIEATQTETSRQTDELTTGDKYLPRQESDFSEPERPVEVEVSTQTDPLPYDEFAMDEDEDVDIEEYIGVDGKIKTLEDILKEEQEAEIERARQLAEAENLAKGIQRFRETSQKSLSEHTRTSRSLSRPITPSAVVVERKKSSPIVFDKQEQIMTEAGLFIHPITYDDFGIPPVDGETEPVDEQQPAVEQIEEILDVNNNLQAELTARLEENLTSTSPELDYDEIIKQAQLNYGDDEGDEDLDSEMQRKIEEMIESVMNTAREEAEWIKESKANDDEEKISNIVDEAIEEPITKVETKLEESTPQEITEIVDEEPPLPPPRRKSNIDESILRREFNKDEDFDTKEPPLPPVPIVSTEEKSEIVEEPIVIKEESVVEETKVVEEPIVTAQDPIEVIKGPVESTEIVAEEPEKSIEVAEDPIEVAENPIEVTEDPIEVTEDPIVVEQAIQTDEIIVNDEPAIEELNIDKIDYENEVDMSTDVDQSEAQEVVRKQPKGDSQLEISQALSEDRPSSPFPSRIHLASLEIDSLSVSNLQAGRITASEIDSHSIVTNEFEAKSSTLPGQTVQIELPPGLIDEIVERVRNADRVEMQLILQEQQKMAEEDRKYAEEQRMAELEKKLIEEQKAAELERKTLEEARIKELERKLAEEQRIAELERKLAEEQKIAELERKLAEEQRIAELERKLAEEQRITELERKLAEEQRIAELERKLAEEQRIAELERKLAEEHRIAELERKLAEERRIADLERRIAEEQRKVAEEKRLIVNEPTISQQIHNTTESVPEPKSDETSPPLRPPLPEDYHQPSSPIPQSFYQLRDFSDDDNKTPHHSTHHRRRKHQPKKKDSTSDDEYPKDPKEQRPRSRAGTSGEQSLSSLGGQFLRACGNSLVDSGNQLMEILRASSKDENKHDLHVALIILIVIIAGLCLMSTGDKSVHHHHWDFFNPPENQGR